MTREQLIEKVCLSSEIQNDECVDCTYCMEVLNGYLDKYDKQIRAEVIDKVVDNVNCYIAEMKEYYDKIQDPSFISAIAEAQKIRRMIKNMIEEQK